MSQVSQIIFKEKNMKIKQIICRIFYGHRYGYSPNDTIAAVHKDGKNVVVDYTMTCCKCGYQKHFSMNMPSIGRE